MTCRVSAITERERTKQSKGIRFMWLWGDAAGGWGLGEREWRGRCRWSRRGARSCARDGEWTRGLGPLKSEGSGQRARCDDQAGGAVGVIRIIRTEAERSNPESQNVGSSLSMGSRSSVSTKRPSFSAQFSAICVLTASHGGLRIRGSCKMDVWGDVPHVSWKSRRVAGLRTVAAMMASLWRCSWLP
jgi:hypothetical protein